MLRNNVSREDTLAGKISRFMTIGLFVWAANIWTVSNVQGAAENPLWVTVIAGLSGPVLLYIHYNSAYNFIEKNLYRLVNAVPWVGQDPFFSRTFMATNTKGKAWLLFLVGFFLWNMVAFNKVLHLVDEDFGVPSDFFNNSMLVLINLSLLLPYTALCAHIMSFYPALEVEEDVTESWTLPSEQPSNLQSFSVLPSPSPSNQVQYTEGEQNSFEDEQNSLEM